MDEYNVFIFGDYNSGKTSYVKSFKNNSLIIDNKKINFFEPGYEIDNFLNIYYAIILLSNNILIDIDNIKKIFYYII